jgi:hypothetical protein
MKYLFFFFIVVQAVFAQPTKNFYLSFYKPSITSTRSLTESSWSEDMINQKVKRDGLSVMLGFERATLRKFFDSFFIGWFIGGGALGDDTFEFITGTDIKKVYWIRRGVIAVPISLGFAFHLVGDEKRRIPDGYDYYYDYYDYYGDGSYDAGSPKDPIFQFASWDIMPSMDLQFFIKERFSFYAGYMNRIRIGDNIVKEDERIFRIPGTLRFGAKLHY